MDDRGEILRCNVTYVPDELRTEQDARVRRERDGSVDSLFVG